MPTLRHEADRVQQSVPDLPALRANGRHFEIGTVVSLDRVAYARICHGDSAMAEMEARRLPKILGQISQVDSSTVEVIWENGRLGLFAYPDAKTTLKWTTTEVLILES